MVVVVVDELEVGVKNFTYLAGKCFEHDLIYSRYNVVLINLHFYTYCAKSSRAIKFIFS